MPICTLHLLSLHPTTSLSTFLHALKSAYPPSSPASSRPLLTSRVIRWVIIPERLSVDALLHRVPHWDILLVTPGADPLPSALTQQHIASAFTLRAGIPKSLVSRFHDTNARLLRPAAADVPVLTGALDGNNAKRRAESAQNLEMTDELAAWIDRWDPEGAKGAVSMLNLLAFKPDMHEEYLKYGRAFAGTIGKRRGGTAKLVGKVVKDDGAGSGSSSSGGGGCEGNGDDDDVTQWDEVAVAHYPSIRHFADMAASEDYQEVNMKWRVPSLKDTCILCTSELDWPEEGDEAENGRSKL